MSAVLALVHRSRIKPRHRRRRKAASVHLVYILNNPLSGKDPTGYQTCVVSEGNSCTANQHDDRSADPFSGRTTFSMNSSGDVHAYSSSGGASLPVNTSGNNGAVAAGRFKGPGAQRTQNVDTPNVGSSAGNTASSLGSTPTLETVSVGAHYPGGESVVPGDWSTSMNGRVLNAEWGQYLGEEEQRNANGMIKGFYSYQLQMVLSQFSGDAPGGGLAGGVGVLRTAGGMAEEGAQAYRSFSAFKRAEGAAGPGMQWHHVVEQTPGNVAQFGPGVIHNTDNLVRLDVATHRQISGFCSSKALGTDMMVRQWLRIQSYEDQHAFAQQALCDFGGGQ